MERFSASEATERTDEARLKNGFTEGVNQLYVRNVENIKEESGKGHTKCEFIDDKRSDTTGKLVSTMLREDGFEVKMGTGTPVIMWKSTIMSGE